MSVVVGGGKSHFSNNGRTGYFSCDYHLSLIPPSLLSLLGRIRWGTQVYSEQRLILDRFILSNALF